MMVMVAEPDALLQQLRTHGFEDADQRVDAFDAAAIFRRRRAERGEIAFERLEPVDQRSGVALQRVDPLMGGAAEEFVAVKLAFDHISRQRRAGDLNRLVADGAHLVERLVEIAFGFAVVAQVVERHCNLTVRSFHDISSFLPLVNAHHGSESF
ncbi:hypothetical protein SDC9_198176 [bioreactor metagenome]|uniref:Uncharacterized protein n=1 Tax=bioreactor metagenome TaxID=1076179 RepID=A0A645IJ91_9ZZZZ